jgi:hypothetical protein
VHRELVAPLDRAAHGVDVGEVDAGVDAVGEQVHAQGDQADVARALAVAEQAAFDPLGAGQQGQLRRRHAGAAVVVGVDRQAHVLAVRQVAVQPLDLVGEDVGQRALDGRREVQDDAPARLRLPHVHHGRAHLEGEVQLGLVEQLGGVLVSEVGAAQHAFGVRHHHLGAAHRELAAAGPVEVEDQPPEQRGRRVVDVDHRPGRALEAVDGGADQLLAGLGQHGDPHVVGDEVALDEQPYEVAVVAAGGGEADLDLLVAHGDQEVEHHELALRGHRAGQGLVAVPQVGGEPARGRAEAPAGPGPVGQVERGESGVAFGALHGRSSFLMMSCSGSHRRRCRRAAVVSCRVSFRYRHCAGLSGKAFPASISGGRIRDAGECLVARPKL